MAGTSRRGRRCRSWPHRGVFASIVAAATLAACALPLTTATAPLGLVGWGAVAMALRKEPDPPAPPPVLIHAEAGHALTPALLAEGPPGSDAGGATDTAAWLAMHGLTQPQLEQGAVLLARIGWTGANPGPRRAVYLPVLRGALVVLEGSLLEVELGSGRPTRLASAQPMPSGQARCIDRELAEDEPGVERLNGRLLGSPRMRTVFTCPTLHSERWQRAAVFWHHEASSARAKAGPEPGMPTRLAEPAVP